MGQLDDMVGKKVVALLVSANHEALYFVTEGGRVFAWVTEGDCCSRSWFTDIDGVWALLGETIFKATEVDMPEADSRFDTEDDYIQVYGYKLETTGGFVDVIFRNASNGYYGGWMDVTVLDQVPDGLVEVTDDWRS